MDREEEIRLIAYGIWEEEGYCHGHDVEPWLKAKAVWQERNKQEGATVETEENAL